MRYHVPKEAAFADLRRQRHKGFDIGKRRLSAKSDGKVIDLYAMHAQTADGFLMKSSFT